MRPLVIRYRKLGDTIMVTPVLSALADAGCDGVFTLGEAPYRRVFADHPAVRGNVDVNDPTPSRVELMKAGIRARRFRCDTAIILRFSRRASVAARLAGCRVLAGSLMPEPHVRIPLTVNVWDESWSKLHQVEKYYRVAEAVAGPLRRLPTLFVPPPEAIAAMADLPGRRVVVHVGSGGSNLGWTDESYAQTVSGFRALGFAVVATGAASEAAAHPLTRAAADLDLVGKTDLDRLAAVFQGASLVVGLDGGATRVASAVKTPVVALSIGLKWGAYQIHPWMAEGALLAPERHCELCSLHRCAGQGRTCVESMRPERVLAAGRRLLGSSCPL